MDIQINMENIPIIYCNTFRKRLLGMMFKKKKQNTIYCFPKCNSIHTFFMFQNIDVIMADRNHNILYSYHNVRPNRIILPKKGVYYTYEFSSNDIYYKQFSMQKKVCFINKR